MVTVCFQPPSAGQLSKQNKLQDIHTATTIFQTMLLFFQLLVQSGYFSWCYWLKDKIKETANWKKTIRPVSQTLYVSACLSQM